MVWGQVRGCSSMPGAGCPCCLHAGRSWGLWFCGGMLGAAWCCSSRRSPRFTPRVCPAVTEDARDLAFSLPGHSVLACFSPPCFSICCSAAPTNVSSVAPSETSPTPAANRTGNTKPRHPGGAGTTPRCVCPPPSHITSHPQPPSTSCPPSARVPGVLHTHCRG